MVENSLFLCAIWHIVQWFREIWPSSAVGGWFHRRAEMFRRWYHGSWVCQVAVREGAIARSWEGSVTCLLLTVIADLPSRFFRWLYRAAQPLWDGSVVFHLVTGVGGAVWFTAGALVMVMLSIDYAKWNNLYAFLGTVAITGLFILASGVQQRQRLQVRALNPYLVLLMAMAVFGTAASRSSSESLRFLVFYITAFLLVLVPLSGIHSYRQLHRMLCVMAVGLTVAGAYGCYQSYIGVEVNASQVDLLLNVGMPGRVYSFFDNANNFAGILVLLTPLLLGLLLNSRHWGTRLFLLVSLGACLVSMAATYSRTGYVGLVLAVMVFVALLNWRLVPVAIVAGLVALPFLPDTIWNRILTIGNTSDSSTTYRFHIWNKSFELLHDHWLTGAGLGSTVVNETFQDYPAMFNGARPVHTHNSYLQMWCEMGIFGMLVYLGMLGRQIKVALRAYTAASREIRTMLAAALGALTGSMAISLMEYTWYYPRAMFIFWFLMGVILVCVRLSRAERTA